jgi:hypothetical protein
MFRPSQEVIVNTKKYQEGHHSLQISYQCWESHPEILWKCCLPHSSPGFRALEAHISILKVTFMCFRKTSGVSPWFWEYLPGKYCIHTCKIWKPICPKWTVITSLIQWAKTICNGHQHNNLWVNKSNTNITFVLIIHTATCFHHCDNLQVNYMNVCHRYWID